LVEVRPDKDAGGMGRTIAAQVPKGLYSEKKIVVSDDGKGGYWIKPQGN
jgi:hypothetical protein